PRSPWRTPAALIGRVGERQDYFFIGADLGPFRARESGRLYLGINDDVLSDNSASLRVPISYRTRPPHSGEECHRRPLPRSRSCCLTSRLNWPTRSTPSPPR